MSRNHGNPPGQAPVSNTSDQGESGLSRVERRARKYRPGLVRQILAEQQRGAAWTNSTDPAARMYGGRYH